MYFYKDSNNLFHINGDILPPGNYILRIYTFETVVAVESADTHTLTMSPIAISSLQKEDNSYYISLAELLFLNAEFFSMVTNEAAAGDHAVLVNVHMAVAGVTQGHINDVDQIIAGNKKFANQAHSGDSLDTFSATKTFDLDEGTVREMPITADTTIEVINEEAGTYIFRLPINTATPPTITVGTSFGTLLGGGAFKNADTDINILTLTVWPSGAKDYLITTN